ncbi:MAG: glutamate formimidoyltransferase [Calditrichaeota bacterium]|nr:MAG: glutamate formimidoyltransferase [Calditrichota bacterium]
MSGIVECVPNFSEGRDKKIIDEITQAITSVDNIQLLSVEMGADVNRTVVTFVGPPETIEEAAFQGIKRAAEVIDMRHHKGAHPRMGATDVCPFVPVEGVTMEDCVEISRKLGRRVGEELQIPVYLYENSAQKPDRKNLATIRHGEYEGLEDKLADPHWKPDYGPARLNAKAGATVIGAREFLIAYNINLNTKEKQYAMDIAFDLREKGRSVREGAIEDIYMRGDLLKYRENHFPCGNCDFVGKTMDETAGHCKEKHGYDLRALLLEHDTDPEDPVGRSVKRPGIFSHCKAIGWYVEEYGRAQISMNLTNYKITPPHIVLEKAREIARERGLVVTGSEVVGLIPFQAMAEAGKYYLRRQDRSTGVPVKDLIQTAIYSMGLNDVSRFVPEEKIIGLPGTDTGPLVSKKAAELVHEVSRESPAPGGGSIAALAGALGAALASMVSNLTVGKKGYEGSWKELSELAEKAQSIKDNLIVAVDEDTNAFNAYMEARRLPKSTKEEAQIREKAIQDGLKQAVTVPWNTAELSFDALRIAARVVESGNINSVTDAGVGAQIAFTGIRGGIFNVLINLPQIKDEKFVFDMKNKCEKIEKDGEKLLQETMVLVKNKIKTL